MRSSVYERIADFVSERIGSPCEPTTEFRIIISRSAAAAGRLQQRWSGPHAGVYCWADVPTVHSDYLPERQGWGDV